MAKYFKINNHNAETNIKYIQPLIVVGAVLGLTPPYCFRTNACSYIKLYKLYCILLAIFFLTFTVYTFYLRIVYVDPLVKGSVAVLNHIKSFFLDLTTFMILLFIPFKQLDNYHGLLDSLRKFDQQLNLPPKRRFNHLYIKLPLTFCLMAFIYAMDVIIWLKVTDETKYAPFGLDKVQMFHMVIFLIFLKEIINVLKYRFINLNRLLVKIVERTMLYNNKKLMNKLVFVLMNDNNHIEEVGRLYGILCDQIKVFNDMFGIIILHSMNTVVVDLLVTINMILLYGSNQIYINDEEKNMSYGMLIVFICWTFILLIIAVAIATACQDTVREAKRSYAICMRYFYRLPTISNNTTEEHLRENLLVLSQQIASRIPRFSAGGFFDVDHTMLFSFLTQITTYLVALIQFNNIA